MVILRKKSIRNIFVDNFMIYNFCLDYISDKTYRFQEKLKKSENSFRLRITFLARMKSIGIFGTLFLQVYLRSLSKFSSIGIFVL